MVYFDRDKVNFIEEYKNEVEWEDMEKRINCLMKNEDVLNEGTEKRDGVKMANNKKL